ncbi:MAG: hypothetical protein H7240_02220 [Glaciimonas sp.]|nr:hypothetical protein [Glaciimonas sp.]
MNKLLVTLIAGLFATSVFAQAPAAPTLPAVSNVISAKANIKETKVKARHTGLKSKAKKVNSVAKIDAKADTKIAAYK